MSEVALSIIHVHITHIAQTDIGIIWKEEFNKEIYLFLANCGFADVFTRPVVVLLYRLCGCTHNGHMHITILS